MVLDRHSGALHLLERVRDEAHRFAITRHTALRTKKTMHSRLDGIPGIGQTRKRALLAQFRTMSAIAQASVDELARAQGMNRPAAQAVYDHFHSPG